MSYPDSPIQTAADEAIFHFARQGVLDYLRRYIDETFVSDDEPLDGPDILHVFTAYVAEFTHRSTDAASDKLIDDALEVVKMHAGMVEGVTLDDDALEEVVENALSLFPRSMFELCLQMLTTPAGWTYETFSEAIHLVTLEGVIGNTM